MNQTDLIGRIMATDRQATMIAQEARQAKEFLDENIQAEIDAIAAAYQEEADRRLDALRKTKERESQEKLQNLDRKLEASLSQVESLYALKKDEWVDSIVSRILGKAGD